MTAPPQAPAGSIGRLRTVVLDCADPPALAAFWGAVLDRPVVEESDDWWELAPIEGGIGIAFQQVARHRPPNTRRPQQLHLDIAVDDLATAERAVLDLGATPQGETHAGAGKPWRVYTDPAGHPFCLCTC